MSPARAARLHRVQQILTGATTMRAEKQYLIAEVETHLKKSDYVILANFTKVTVADVAELRSQARRREGRVPRRQEQLAPRRGQGPRPARIRKRADRPDGRRRRRKEFRRRREDPEEVLRGQAEARSEGGRASTRRSSPPPTSPRSPTCLRSRRCARSCSACSRRTPPRSSASSTPRSRRSSPQLRPPNPSLQPVTNHFFRPAPAAEAKHPTRQARGYVS